MQDCEFTIERGKLWMLQTRTGKRSGAAAVRIAVEMVYEKLIDKKTAVQRVTPEQLDQLLHPTVDPKTNATVLATGLPASPGAAQGQVVFSPDEAEEMAREGARGRPGSSRKQSRRFSWHGGRTGNRDRERRNDEPRSCCCARYGKDMRQRR